MQFQQQSRDHAVHVGEIEKLIHDRSQIPMTLDLSKPLETKMANVRLWKEQLAKTFRIRSPADTLLKVGDFHYFQG